MAQAIWGHVLNTGGQSFLVELTSHIWSSSLDPLGISLPTGNWVTSISVILRLWLRSQKC